LKNHKERQTGFAGTGSQEGERRLLTAGSIERIISFTDVTEIPHPISAKREGEKVTTQTKNHTKKRKKQVNRTPAA